VGLLVCGLVCPVVMHSFYPQADDRQ
jgi:hypothetical protein